MRARGPRVTVVFVYIAPSTRNPIDASRSQKKCSQACSPKPKFFFSFLTVPCFALLPGSQGSTACGNLPFSHRLQDSSNRPALLSPPPSGRYATTSRKEGLPGVLRRARRKKKETRKGRRGEKKDWRKKNSHRETARKRIRVGGRHGRRGRASRLPRLRRLPLAPSAPSQLCSAALAS